MTHRLHSKVILSIFAIIALCLASNPAWAATPQVELYGVFEFQVTNDKTYQNPFDFQEVELQATFTAPSNKTADFFGFYAGDGQGGQTGNVWKLRFMPDEVGTWAYTYTWTDGSPGGSGSFEVVDTGLPGPLKIATDNPWYFMDSRGNKVDARPYDLHHKYYFTSTTDWHWHEPEAPNYVSEITSSVVGAGYNIIMIDLPAKTSESGQSLWHNDAVDVFDISVWRDVEEIIGHSCDNQVHAFSFLTLAGHGNPGHLTDNLKRYFIARLAPFYCFFGYSPTWEWTAAGYSADGLSALMNDLKAWSPFPTLLSAHDHSDSSFTDWMGFSMRQLQSRNVFVGNTRTGGWHGGVESPLTERPIFGSEDVWETPDGSYNEPRNPTEVRRGAWGILMAGVIPVYSEWSAWAGDPGNLPGEAEIIRMFDFFYSKTKYRGYIQKNSLVSSSQGQICSGITDQEYLVYDEDGGTIDIDLTEARVDTVFQATWFDPTSGASQDGGTVNGGAPRTFGSPFSADSVLLLTSGGVDLAPSAPSNLQILD